MRVVLGIDAAWTAAQPSGVALAVESPSGWELRAAASSYASFCSTAHSGYFNDPDRPTNAQEALTVASVLAGRSVDLVAVDMPLSLLPIISRRASDDAVSTAYGNRWASTHTPSATRPGKISDDLRIGFAQRGYLLQTSGNVSGGLIEVYPHPALIEFSAAERRLPYKFGNRRKYWPDQSSYDRVLNIWLQMRAIVGILENEVAGVDDMLPLLNWASASAKEWKAYEDTLDAVVCAAVGICVLEGRAIPFGDKNSSIWVPKPGCARAPRRHIMGVRTGAI
ncbi:MAG: DUF429 domain-containing protein [Mesorhizobium sp.]